MTTEYRRILLDGYPILTTRHGDELVTKDGRSIGVDEAVHPQGRRGAARALQVPQL